MNVSDVIFSIEEIYDIITESTISVINKICEYEAKCELVDETRFSFVMESFMPFRRDMDEYDDYSTFFMESTDGTKPPKVATAEKKEWLRKVNYGEHPKENRAIARYIVACYNASQIGKQNKGQNGTPVVMTKSPKTMIACKAGYKAKPMFCLYAVDAIHNIGNNDIDTFRYQLKTPEQGAQDQKGNQCIEAVFKITLPKLKATSKDYDDFEIYNEYIELKRQQDEHRKNKTVGSPESEEIRLKMQDISSRYNIEDIKKRRRGTCVTDNKNKREYQDFELYEHIQESNNSEHFKKLKGYKTNEFKIRGLDTNNHPAAEKLKDQFDL